MDNGDEQERQRRSELGRALAALRRNPGRKPEPVEDPELAERRAKIREYMQRYRDRKRKGLVHPRRKEEAEA